MIHLHKQLCCVIQQFDAVVLLIELHLFQSIFYFLILAIDNTQTSDVGVIVAEIF
jgi:hypothetical protein